MTDIPPAVALHELLAYTATENDRWRQWFIAHPGALDAAYGDAPLATARDVIRHVAFVEQRYAAIVAGAALPAPPAPGAEPPEVLFAYVSDVRRQFRDAVEHADMAREREFMTLTAGQQRASTRKIVSHALLHGIRHWAQLATVLRQQGHRTDWPHDLLLSSAMQ